MGFVKYISILLILVTVLPLNSNAQENYKTKEEDESLRIFNATEFYEVKKYDESVVKKYPKNIIYMIGDGMGTTHIYAAMTANKGNLYFNNFTNIGFITTFSSDDYTTDSAAGGTALSSGIKTKNGIIGLDESKKPVKNIRETMEEMGKATGVVSTSSITHATPASFVAHQPFREMYEAIAADYLKTNIDVFIGGGLKHFTKRKDGKDLTVDLKNKGYQLAKTIEEVKQVKSGKLAALLAPEHLAKITEGRGNMLETATQTAIDILSDDPEGFFLMVEGSQIDWGGHQNNMKYLVSETLDFDKAIGIALEFAAQDRETLVIVTADHETSGLSITSGNIAEGKVTAAFGSGDHTGVMVPVFAFGPGSEMFRGIYDNTEIVKKINQLKIK